MRAAVVGTLVIVVLTGCGRSRPPEPPAPEPPLTWKRITTPDGSCSAEFPEQWELKEEPRQGELPSLSATPNHLDAYFMLSAGDIPLQVGPFTDEGLLDLFRESGPRNFGQEPHTSQRIVMDGCPGWECEYRQSPKFAGTARVKLFIRAGKVYQIAAITMFSEKFGDASQHFLDSFRFEKAKP